MAKRRPAKTKTQGRTVDGRFYYARVPHELAKDRTLKAIDTVIATLVEEWLCDRPSGWVFNDILAEGADVEVRCVQLSLRRLQQGGWYSCEKADNDGRRRITRLFVFAERADGARKGANPCAGGARKCAPRAHGNAPPAAHGNAPKEQSEKNNHKNLPPLTPPGGGGTREDDGFSLSLPEGEIKTTADLGRGLFRDNDRQGGDVGAMVEANAADIHRRLGGQWTHYRDALRKAAAHRSSAIGDLHAYCMKVAMDRRAKGVAEVVTVDPAEIRARATRRETKERREKERPVRNPQDPGSVADPAGRPRFGGYHLVYHRMEFIKKVQGHAETLKGRGCDPDAILESVLDGERRGRLGLHARYAVEDTVWRMRVWWAEQVVEAVVAGNKDALISDLAQGKTKPPFLDSWPSSDDEQAVESRPELKRFVPPPID